MATNCLVDKKMIVYLYNGIYSTLTRQEPQIHCAERKEAETKDYIMYDFIST